MSLDTSDFDIQIAGLTQQIADAQKSLDTDQLNIQLVALKAKSDALGILQNKINDVQLARSQAIAIQNDIDQKNQDLVDLKASVQ